jgi:CRP-like cAMP-binding protein
MSKVSTASSNRLLALLPAAERNRVLEDCVETDLAFGSILHEQGGRIGSVYFPTHGFISMLATLDGRSTLEVGMIGNEGMCGYTLALDSPVAPLRALVQGAGAALRMRSGTFLEHLRTQPALRLVVNRYVYVHLRQIAQAAVCLRFHVVEKRLARWLLMTRDRAHADSFYVTQDFLASMLGVRRVGVSAAASTLQAQGLVRYVRGDVTIIDGKGLEAASCACYRSDLAIHRQGMSARPVARH